MNEKDRVPTRSNDATLGDLKQGGGDPAATLPSRDRLDPGGAADLTGTDGDAPRNVRDVDDAALEPGSSGPTQGLGEAIGSGAGSGDVGSGTPDDHGGIGGGGAEGGVGQR